MTEPSRGRTWRRRIAVAALVFAAVFVAILGVRHRDLAKLQARAAAIRIGMSRGEVAVLMDRPAIGYGVGGPKGFGADLYGTYHRRVQEFQFEVAPYRVPSVAPATGAAKRFEVATAST